MFDSPFPHTKINHQKKTVGEITSIEFCYTFRNFQNKRYLCIVELFEEDVYAVKFCFWEHKNYPDRFERITGLFECHRVIGTIIKILLEVFQSNNKASFIFVGSTSKGETAENNKRIRIYSAVIAAKVSIVYFEHRKAKLLSAYMLLNRSNPDAGFGDRVEQALKELLR